MNTTRHTHSHDTLTQGEGTTMTITTDPIHAVRKYMRQRWAARFVGSSFIMLPLEPTVSVISDRNRDLTEGAIYAAIECLVRVGCLGDKASVDGEPYLYYDGKMNRKNRTR